MRLFGWFAFRLLAEACTRHRLIGACFILVPHCQAQLFSHHVRAFDQGFFRSGIRVLYRHHSMLALAWGGAGLTPRPTLLPALASLMPDTPNRVGADVRQTSRCSTQAGFQQRE